MENKKGWWHSFRVKYLGKIDDKNIGSIPDIEQAIEGWETLQTYRGQVVDVISKTGMRCTVLDQSMFSAFVIHGYQQGKTPEQCAIHLKFMLKGGFKGTEDLVGDLLDQENVARQLK